jgi:GntR family transcriptional regulator
VIASGRSPEMKGPEVGIRRAGAVIGPLLKIPEETEVIYRHQNGYVDDLPWSRQTSYYPRNLAVRAPRLLDTSDIGGGAVGYLAEVGVRQDGYQDSIGWRTPDEAETTYFDLPADGHVQIAEIRRIAFDQDENRVRLTFTTYRADRNRFVINVGHVPKNATA